MSEKVLSNPLVFGVPNSRVESNTETLDKVQSYSIQPQKQFHFSAILGAGSSVTQLLPSGKGYITKIVLTMHIAAGNNDLAISILKDASFATLFDAENLPAGDYFYNLDYPHKHYFEQGVTFYLETVTLGAGDWAFYSIHGFYVD